MVFIAIHDKLRHLRVNGEATVRDEDPQMAKIVGAQLVVRVVAQAIFPNCPRYIRRDLAVTPQSRLGRSSRTARNMCTRAGRLLEVVANRSPAGERAASAGA
jgi:uncharacterized protein